MLHILLTGMHAGTKKNLQRDMGLSSETLALFAKLDEQAHACAEERERKRMLLEAELEGKGGWKRGNTKNDCKLC